MAQHAVDHPDLPLRSGLVGRSGWSHPEPNDRSMARLERAIAVLILIAAIALPLMHH